MTPVSDRLRQLLEDQWTLDRGLGPALREEYTRLDWHVCVALITGNVDQALDHLRDQARIQALDDLRKKDMDRIRADLEYFATKVEVCGPIPPEMLLDSDGV